MNILILFIIIMGLAMDCFAISITNSSVSGVVKPGIPLKTALIFTLGHLALAWLGYWLGGLISSLVTGIEIWVAFLVLVSVGGKMVFEAYRRRPEAKVFDINNISVILALALAASMDALLVGIVISILGGSIWLGSGLIALTVFVFTLSGLAGGINLGLSFARKVSITGGIFMLIAAFWFLFILFR